MRRTRSVVVCTFIPAATGVVHEAGVPPRPSISTRHSRHDPNAFSVSVAQSFGTLIPANIAARMTDVPSGTVICCPSTVSVTVLSNELSGVPKSASWIIGITASTKSLNQLSRSPEAIALGGF